MTAYALASPAGSVQASPHARGPRTRIYAVQTPVALARRKAVARGGLIAIVLAGLAAIAPGAIAGDEPGSAAAFDTYTVAQGETLWSIASALTAPGEQVRETLTELKEINAMSGSSLRAGEQIAIPVLDR